MAGRVKLIAWKKYLSIGLVLMLASLSDAVEQPLGGKAMIAAKATALITLEQTAYQGHDDGESCDTKIAQTNLTLIDKDKDRKEQISLCFKITNVSQVWLSDITLKGFKPELIHNDFLAMTDPMLQLLAPQTSIIFYYEYLLEETLNGQFSVEAEVVDKEGKPLAITRNIQVLGKIKAEFLVAPPIVHKTVLPRKGKGMLWQLELVNNSDQQTMVVSINDKLPEYSVFEAQKMGEYISETGVYCEAMGVSTTSACYFESASGNYPQGRVVWKGEIASDFAKPLEYAENKVTIRFTSNAPEAEIGDIISSQARSHWGNEQNEVLSDNPATDTVADPTPYKIHKLIEAELEVMQIPTLSEWGIILLSVIMLLLVRFRLLFIK